MKTFFTLFCSFILTFISVRAQVCTTEVFTKSINVEAPNAQFLLVLPGGGLIFGGRSFGSIDQLNVIKTTPEGNIVFNKRIDGFSSSNLSTATLTPDKKILMGRRANLVLTDTNGVVQKSALTTMPWGTHYIHDVKTDTLGNVYALYEASGGGNKQYVLTKISPDLSAILWTVTFGADYTASYRSVMVDGDKVFVAGSFPFSYGSDSDGSILCFSAINGALTRQVSLTLDGFKCTMKTIHKTKDGYLAEGFYYPIGTPNSIENHVIVRLDNTLQPVKAVRLTGIPNTSPLYIEPDGQGGFYASAGSAWIRFFHCNQQDSVTSSTIILNSGIGAGQFATSATNLYAIDQSCWSIVKADLNGYAGGCNEATVPTGTAPLQPAAISKSVTPVNGFLSIGSASHRVTNAAFTITRDCKAVSVCSSLKIAGPPRICSDGTPTMFKGQRNLACRLPVQWEIKGSPADISIFNDSTISVQFLSSGHYQLIASLSSSCDTISDTLEIDVTISSQQALNLGPDRELCENNTLLLNATKGYSSYLWQDGSRDSTYIVTLPGLYHVTVTNACGGVFRDSVLVTAAPRIPFDVGPDRSKCNQDTLQFRAPGNYLNYSWSPAYNISSTTQQAVVVNPLVDTAYFVKAERTPGCFAYDTIYVRVFHSPPINLGLDVSFCSGDSITLNAGSGFNSYTWDNMAGNQFRTVFKAGTYTVAGQTEEGCWSHDTIRVLNVWAPPIVKLDKNPQLCFGSSKTLFPGNFPGYQWQDGSNTATFRVSAAGRYWVQVTDNNGCTGSDTTEVTTILPLPQDFLPGDTTICSYSTIMVKPLQAFRSYLWNNSSRSSSLTIDRQGEYWLEVTNEAGCMGRDSITVRTRQCSTGVYIPTAFTPNKDRKNDLFKAVVFGIPKRFELTVYNRWGQVVFSTTEVDKGWNGTFAAKELDTGVFVWTCRYQLEGGQENFERGTVTLVR